MKKLSLFVLLVAAFVFAAQECFSQHPIFATGGIHESWIQGNDPFWDGGLAGGQAGVGTIIARYKDHLSLSGELNFSFQGAEWTIGETEGTIKMTYLSLPLVIRYLDKARFYGEIGIQPGLLLSAEEKWPGHEVNQMKYLNHFDIGIPIGAGYEFKNNFGVGLRVVLGMNNINETTGEQDNHNVLVALRVTYTFRKKVK